MPAQRPVATAAALRQRSQADPVRPGRRDFGPFYAYEKPGEDFAVAEARAVRHRIGAQDARRSHPGLRPARLRATVRQLRPGRHQRPEDPRRSPRLAVEPYDAIFTQDANPRPGDGPPLGRLQVTRDTTGGELHTELQTGQ